MPDQLLDNAEPQGTQEADPNVDANAAGGRAPIPQVSINRSTVAELERRRILRAQESALLILAIGAVLTMLYVAKLILVVVLVSILIAFVLAPLVDLLGRLNIPNSLASLISRAVAGDCRRRRPLICPTTALCRSCRNCRSTRPGSSR